MKKVLLISFIAVFFSTFVMAQETKNNTPVLNDELCDVLSKAAQEKSKELGIEISFAISDNHGQPKLYRRFGEALVLSITLVPAKAYTSAVTQTKTEDLAKVVIEGGVLQGINTADSRITLVTGGFPLFYNGKIIGAIGIGGGTETQDREIGEYVMKVFENTIKQN